MEEFVLLLQEVNYHPNSYLEKLDSKFESPSIIRVTKKEELRKVTKPPLFDEKYLVLFDELKLFQENRAYLSLKLMFPVLHVESKSALDDAVFYMKEYNIPYKIFCNVFTEEEAKSLIYSQASQDVSESVCKAIIRQVGLNPLRIITAVGVCEQMGYSVSTVEKYIDKWMYPDIRKLIECLLGVPSNGRAVQYSMRYLHLNRHWYRFVRKNIVDELDSVLDVYKDKLNGDLYNENMYNYLEEKRVTRARVMFALKLFDRVSISTVFALREFVKNSNLVDIVLRLS